MQTVEWFKQIVPIANPSGKEAEIRTYILEHLNSFGYSDTLVDEAGNLFVRIPGDPNKETIMLSAHMDSVPPCEGIEPQEDTHEGRRVIRSSGKTILGADDKSGIATIISLMQRLSTQGNGSNHPMELLFSTQEEVGLLGAKAFDLKLCKSTMGLVLDGEGSIGDIFYAGPSQKNLVFELEGLRSHAGIAPEAGVNAIEMATRLCAALPSGRLSEETTMNLGTIQGGDAFNVVAPSTIIRGEARSHNETVLSELLEKIENTCQTIQTRYPRGKVKFTPNQRYTGYTVPQNHMVVLKSIAACQKLGISHRVARMNIGSDAHVLNHGGLPTVVLGMGFHFSHSLGEFIYVDELEKVTDWVWEIIHS